MSKSKVTVSYIATFEPAHVFADLVEAEGIRRGSRHVRQFTIHGAAWIWGIAGATFPEATQIGDIWHVREHLHDLARLLEFMLGDLARRPSARPRPRRHRPHLRRRPPLPLVGVKKDQLDTALGYFETNAPAPGKPSACGPALTVTKDCN